MIPWICVATAAIPNCGGDLRLMQRGGEFSIVMGSVELMNSRRGRSEEALATLSCDRLRASRPRLLIGGLGMGFTLRAALAALGGDARIVVAELVPSVVAWARGPLADVFGDCLDDPRVAIHEGDVGDLIATGMSAYDAILLDVDNGPDGLTRLANEGLYGPAGIGAARAALRPRGLLAIWSAERDDRFAMRLRRSGFAGVEEIGVKAAGTRHVIWIARR